MRLAILAAALFLGSCVSRQGMVNDHPEWPEDVKKEIVAGRVRPGMTHDQVMACWGKSLSSMSTTETAAGFSETLFFEAHSDPWAIGNDANLAGSRYCPRGRWAVRLDMRKMTNGQSELVVSSVSSY